MIYAISINKILLALTCKFYTSYIIIIISSLYDKNQKIKFEDTKHIFTFNKLKLCLNTLKYSKERSLLYFVCYLYQLLYCFYLMKYTKNVPLCSFSC